MESMNYWNLCHCTKRECFSVFLTLRMVQAALTAYLRAHFLATSKSNTSDSRQSLEHKIISVSVCFDQSTLISPLSPSMSKPMLVLPSLCAAYNLAITSFGFTPEFSASTLANSVLNHESQYFVNFLHLGTTSRASANLLMLYCSKPA